MITKFFLSLAAVFAPVLVFAQSTGDGPDFDGIYGIIEGLINVVNALIPLLISVAVVVFFFGLIRYVLAKGPDAKENARSILLYGLLSLFIILTFWGIIIFFANILDLNVGGGIQGLNPYPEYEGLPGADIDPNN